MSSCSGIALYRIVYKSTGNHNCLMWKICVTKKPNHNGLIEFGFETEICSALIRIDWDCGAARGGSAARCPAANASVSHLSELHGDDATRIKVGTQAIPNMSVGQMAGGLVSWSPGVL